MNVAMITLLAGLVIWMCLSAWCGYRLRLLRFLAVLVGGIAVYTIWVVIALQTSPLDPNAFMAMIAGVMYALSAFGIGYLVGRLARQFKASQVDSNGV